MLVRVGAAIHRRSGTLEPTGMQEWRPKASMALLRKVYSYPCNRLGVAVTVKDSISSQSGVTNL